MVTKAIDIKSLNLEELSGVVSIYPWYGAARFELCKRMSELGEGAWSEERFAEAALYIGSRRIIAALSKKGKTQDYSDKDVHHLLASLISKADKEGGEKKIIVLGADYFSCNDYENVRKDNDNDFAKFAQTGSGPTFEDIVNNDDVSDLCTETLAEIYLEQGYPEQAKAIYLKLSLLYPEKSVYFASLIEKINEK